MRWCDDENMTNVVVRAALRLLDPRRAESGESLGAFSLILLFAIVAGAIAIVLLSGGLFEINPSAEAPNFEPPNPFD